jgi:hypothetical protein
LVRISTKSQSITITHQFEYMRYSILTLICFSVIVSIEYLYLTVHVMFQISALIHHLVFWKKTTFRKLDLFQYAGEMVGWEDTTPLYSLERANSSHCPVGSNDWVSDKSPVSQTLCSLRIPEKVQELYNPECYITVVRIAYKWNMHCILSVYQNAYPYLLRTHVIWSATKNFLLQTTELDCSGLRTKF